MKEFFLDRNLTSMLELNKLIITSKLKGRYYERHQKTLNLHTTFAITHRSIFPNEEKKVQTYYFSPE